MSEVILIIGYPCSGKSTLAKEYVDKSYVRFNRDSLGGTLKGVSKKFSEFLSENPGKNYVLDNTYSTKVSRESILDTCRENSIKVKCVWLQTSIEDAQFNMVGRLYKMFNTIPSPAYIKSCKDPNVFLPLVQFKYRKEFEEPTLDEGFDEVIPVKFERTKQGNLYSNKGLLLDYDGTLRETISGDIFPTSPNDVRILPGRREFLDKYVKRSYTLVGISNQSGVHKGTLTEEEAKKCFEKTNELLGMDIPVLYCPHQSNPISCYCRKPMPGLGVLAIEKYHLDISKTIMVGDMTTDETFAKRCGFDFKWTEDFFRGRPTYHPNPFGYESEN